MSDRYVLTTALAVTAFCLMPVRGAGAPGEETPMPEIRRATPILYLDAIEPSLDLWTRFGFQRTAEVPHGGGLGFVILEKAGVEIMLQTLASAREDDAGLAAGLAVGQGVIYFDVADLSAVEEVLRPEEIVVPRRTTSYGAEEVFIRDPAGNVLGFAEMTRTD